MEVIVPALKILGIALTSSMVGRFMEERGHGGKVVFLNVVAHVACAYIVVDLLRSAFTHVIHVLGVLG